MSARLLWAQGLLPRSLRAGGTNSLLATETLATRLLTSTRLTTTLLTGCGSLLPKPAALPITYALEAGIESGAQPVAAPASAPILAVSARRKPARPCRHRVPAARRLGQ